MIEERQCLGCKIWQPLLTCFDRDPKSSGGRRAQCRACLRAARGYTGRRMTAAEMAERRNGPTDAQYNGMADAWRYPVARGQLTPALRVQG